MSIEVKLTSFEGPLDLLLHLIEKNKVDIYDIPIAVIADQYMEYVNTMDKQDLDMVSDFLVMASTLLDIKSRMLLPAEEDEEGEEIDPREELVARLVEYKMCKDMANELKIQYEEHGGVWTKKPTVPQEVLQYVEPVDPRELLKDTTLLRLEQIFNEVLRRQEDKVDPIRSKFGTIKKDPVRLSDKLAYVYDYGNNRKKFSFRNLLEEQHSKADVVVTFLACLELIKIGRLLMQQEDTFAEIDLEWNPNCTTEITKEEMEQYD